MSEWKVERVRARLARQGAEDRRTPPAKKKALERAWMIVRIAAPCGWRYERDADGNLQLKDRNDPLVLKVQSHHRSEEDARRQMQKHSVYSRGADNHRCFVVHQDVLDKLKPLWN